MANLSKTELRLLLKWATGIKELEEEARKAYPELPEYKGTAVTIRGFYNSWILGSYVQGGYGSFKGNGARLMICPMHDDAAPSMGTVVDKDGLEIFNCFGCKRAGTVYDLAQQAYKHRYGSRLSQREALNWVFGKSNEDRLLEFFYAVKQSDRAAVEEGVEADSIMKVAQLDLMGIDRDVISAYTEAGKRIAKGENLKAAVADLQRTLIYDLTAPRELSDNE